MTYHVNKEPVLCINGILIKEESSADETLSEEVGRERRKPPEHVEASAGLEHEEGGHLLDEQTNDDSPPFDVRSASRRRPKAELEDE
jgi:hypothetical protein